MHRSDQRARRPWIVAFMSYVALLGTEKDFVAVYRVADSIYPDSRLMDPARSGSVAVRSYRGTARTWGGCVAIVT